MSKDEVLSNLCYYDERNPDGIKDDADAIEYHKESMKKVGAVCYCESCFARRTPLAEEILRLNEELVKWSIK